MSETPNEPIQQEPQYSGPYEGDPRDPQQIGEALPGFIDQLDEIQLAREELDAAREAHKKLVDPSLRGDDRHVSDEELRDASERFARALSRVNSLQPPQ